MANVRSAFEPVVCELPLDGLEAFRLASFGILYEPRYLTIHYDSESAKSRIWTITPQALKAWGAALYG